jgi:hypothetical protein
MAALQSLARALRDEFKDSATAVQLAEILKFIENFKDTLEPSEKTNAFAKEGENTNVTRENASQTTRQATQQRQQQQQPQQTERKRPSYAEMAKKKGASKAPYVPQSVKDARKKPKPIKISLGKPLEETPGELIAKIRERAINAERIISLIRAIKPITRRQALILTNADYERAELLQNNSWLDAIGARLYRRNYSVVIHRVEKSLSREEILGRIREQNPILQGEENLAVQWLSKRDSPLGSLKIDMEDPIVANRTIQEGIVLDYEIKRVYQYIPRKRPTHKPQEKLYYRERQTTPECSIFRAGPEISTQER